MARETPTPLVLKIEEPRAGRLDTYLVQNLQGPSRSTIQAWIRAGQVLVNGSTQKTGYALEEGDEISIAVAREALRPTVRGSELKPIEMPLSILYEDEALIVLDKPAGLVVHPGAGTRGRPTLVAGVLAHLGAEAGDLPGDSERPGVVHRLDKDTSGVMVIAKTKAAHRHLANQFKNKTNLREYAALLDGVLPEEEQTVESYLSRDPRFRIRFVSHSLEDYAARLEAGQDLHSYRYAKTHFIRRKVYGKRLSLCLLKLDTGRTHQIRVHARSLGLPVWGDSLYGASQRLPPDFPTALKVALQAVPRHLLHARRLGFEHPQNGRRLAFEAPLPEDFRSVLELLEKHSQS